METADLDTLRVPVSEIDAVGSADRLASELQSLTGVEEASVQGSLLTVHYVAELTSGEAIKREIGRLGYDVAVPEKRRGMFNRFLDRMIESNRKSFGNETLDCCTINSKNKKKPTAS